MLEFAQESIFEEHENEWDGTAGGEKKNQSLGIMSWKELCCNHKLENLNLRPSLSVEPTLRTRSLSFFFPQLRISKLGKMKLELKF